MRSAGVNTEFKAHSTRAASTSTAKRMDVPLKDILAQAGWAKENTFQKFYDRPLESKGKKFTDAAALEAKDAEIDRLNLIIHQQKDQITASEIDTDKTSVVSLAKIKELSDKLQNQLQGDDDVMTELNNKVEVWKAALEAKDAEIDRLNLIIHQQKDQITASEIDTDKTSVVSLAKALQQKEAQLTALRHQLEESAREMDERAEELEMLKNDASSGAAPTVRLQNMVTKLRETLREQEKEMKAAEGRVQQAETDARKKDKELNEAINRMKDYEEGEYGLAEAVQEIKLGKKQIALRDRNIEQLTQNVNKAEIQLNELLEENEELRSRLGFDPKQPIDMEQARLYRGQQHQQDRALNQVL
eukprot:XP_011680049.1 PREDICTED: centrosomal protein of 290 kDa-like [Strongylocentrotus purpuratus]